MMNRTILYSIIAVLAVVAGLLAYQTYKDRQKPTGVEIKFDNHGLSIQQK